MLHVASQKARVVEAISSSPPPVPAGHNGAPVASAPGVGGSDRHARDPGFVTVGRGRRRQGRGIVLNFFCRVCVTGLPECGLGCSYDLAYGSVWWMAMGGGCILFIP